jgi:addiction module HigA family antidote
MIRVPIDRTPTHPGEMLLEEFLNPMGLTQRELAQAIHVPYQRINDLVNGRRDVTPSTALRLAMFFGNTPDIWLNLQLRWDLYFVEQRETPTLEISSRMRRQNRWSFNLRSVKFAHELSMRNLLIVVCCNMVTS